MTNQTIYISFIVKIKRTIFPPITGMTTCATSLVADGANSEIIQRGGTFTVLNLLSTINGMGRGAFPLPMGRQQHLFTSIFMTAETLLGNLTRRWIFRQFDQLFMIRDIVFVTAQTLHRTLVIFLMALQALQVISRF